MGELASLLAEVAEALTYYPGDLQVADGDEAADAARAAGASAVVNAREWPSIQEIEQLIANWRELQRVERTASAARAGRRASA